MQFSDLFKKGLLGYQPIFFPNGVISGAGYQFFHNFRNADNNIGKTKKNIDDVTSKSFNKMQVGNLYIPKTIQDSSEFDTKFYFSIDENELIQFTEDNLVLLNIYKHFALESLNILNSNNSKINSMIEVGCNTAVFPSIFSKAGVALCNGADIVDYSPVIDLLEEIEDVKIDFYHMDGDTENVWDNLPKSDLVWSYAVMLHQSNPLEHITRLASLAKKAIFIMTLVKPKEWEDKDELGIKYLSSNSYYTADFPNCFDMTVMSPGLIKYSLKRLGFNNIVEIKYPKITKVNQSGLDDWLSMHCFYLAYRDSEKTEEELDDYTVETERSPYDNDYASVYIGYSNSIILLDKKYYIVKKGIKLDDTEIKISFASLNKALIYIKNLDEEKNPKAHIVKKIDKYNIVEYKNYFYLCKKDLLVDDDFLDMYLTLSVVDSLDKWLNLISLIGEKGIENLLNMQESFYLINDFTDDICTIKTEQDTYEAYQVTCIDGIDIKLYKFFSSNSLDDVLKEIKIKKLKSSMFTFMEDDIIYTHVDGTIIKRNSLNNFQVLSGINGDVLQESNNMEGAWSYFID